MREAAVLIGTDKLAAPAREGWQACLQLEYSIRRRSHHADAARAYRPADRAEIAVPRRPRRLSHADPASAGRHRRERHAGRRSEAETTAPKYLITMPGATKWYRTADAPATQKLNARVGMGATLEWLPPETIVFDRAAVRMQTSIDLRGGNYIGWEVLCLGRTASGETYDAGDIRQTTEISSGRRARLERALPPAWRLASARRARGPERCAGQRHSIGGRARRSRPSWWRNAVRSSSTARHAAGSPRCRIFSSRAISGIRASRQNVILSTCGACCGRSSPGATPSRRASGPPKGEPWN